jgi:uncharacterized protein (TIGR03435 family)
MLLAAWRLFGQSKPQFEVASIKQFAAGRPISMAGCQGGPGTDEPTRVTCSYTSLLRLIVRAYGVKPYQVSGPPWLDTEHYDVLASVPLGASKDELPLMFQNLLAERFGLTLHRERRDLAAYSLIVGREGDAKLAAATQNGTGQENESPSGKPALGKDGFPMLPASALVNGPITIVRKGRARMQGDNLTLTAFATALSDQLDQLVFNETGLEGRYAITLYWSVEERAARGRAGVDSHNSNDTTQADPSPDSDLFVAVHQQLGLRLVPKKRSADILVVDHADRSPTAN